MGATRKKKHRSKRLLSLLKKTLNVFVIGNDFNAGAIQNGIIEPQISGLVTNFGKTSVRENYTNHDQVTERNIADKLGLTQLHWRESLTRF